MPGPSFAPRNSASLPCPPRRSSSQRQPKVSHTLRRTGGDRLEQETHAGGQVFHAVVEYAFGSGDRGLTLVGRDDHGQERELRLSHYRDEAAFVLGRDLRSSCPSLGPRGKPGRATDGRRSPPLLPLSRHQPIGRCSKGPDQERTTTGSAARNVTGRAETTCSRSPPSFPTWQSPALRSPRARLS